MSSGSSIADGNKRGTWLNSNKSLRLSKNNQPLWVYPRAPALNVYLHQCDKLWVVSCCKLFVSLSIWFGYRYVYCASHDHSTASYEYMSYDTDTRTSLKMISRIICPVASWYFLISKLILSHPFQFASFSSCCDIVGLDV